MLAEATTDQGIADLVAKLWPVVAGLATVAAAVWAWAQRQRRALAKEREEQRLQGKAVRYLMDAARHQLRAHLQGTVDRELHDELARQKALIDSVRDELWVQDGHESARRTERIAEELTRTIRIKLKTERLQFQDMFSPDDLETK